MASHLLAMANLIIPIVMPRLTTVLYMGAALRSSSTLALE